MNRAPGTIWATRRDMTGPYVRTSEGDMIELAFPIYLAPNAVNVEVLDRSTARLLAKRINQCLDETAKR